MIYKVFVLFLVIEVTMAELRMAAVYFRHGHRAPIVTYPNNPNINYHWDRGLGELTKLGEKQITNLAKTLRERYASITLKSDRPLSENINMQCTDVQRCILSAQSFLRPFTPPNGESPIPILTLPKPEDNIVYQFANCPKYFEQLSYYVNNPPEKVKKLLEADKDTIKELAEKTGITLDNVHHLSELYDTIFVETNEGLEQPDYIKKLDKSFLQKYGEQFMLLISYTDYMKKVKSGPLLTEIISNVQKMQNKKPVKKLWLYAGHDSNILALGRALQVDDQIDAIPECSSAFTLEFYETEKEGLIIKLFYFKNSSVIEPTELFIPNCTKPLKFNDFVDKHSSYIVDDFACLCKNKE